MAKEATIRNNRRMIRYRVAGAAVKPGTIVQVPDGRPGVVVGANTIQVGDFATADTECQAEVVKASATVFANGAEVQWNNTTKLAVTTGGDFRLGLADTGQGGGGAGTTFVRTSFGAVVTAAT